MLRSIGLRHYRAFVADVEVELRPLTVLFGPNSAGKSALLRAIPITAASAGPIRPNRTGPLALEHAAAMGASYADLHSKLTSRTDLVIRLRWLAGEPDLAVEYQLRDRADLTRRWQVVERMRLIEASGKLLAEIVLDVDDDRHKIGSAVVEIRGLRPICTDGISQPLRRALAHTAQQLEQLAERVDWLGPLRTAAPRQAQPSDNPTIVHDGCGTTELLAHRDSRELLRRVSERTRNMFGHELAVVPVAGDVALAARHEDGRDVALADVGSGVSQVVPVLAQLARVELGAAAGRIVAIEQPEAHLHADAEIALGRAVAAAVTATATQEPAARPRLVLESHSENLLMALQLAVLEQRLASDDFVAYWIARPAHSTGAVAKKITFDAQARPDPPWPAGVFSEDTALAREILHARRRKTQ